MTSKYAEIAGAGGEMTITNIDYDEEADEIRLTFLSAPGRTYALDSSDNLQAASWSEINDSIPSDGAETTVILGGITLPDPENPKLFYRLRPGVE